MSDINKQLDIILANDPKVNLEVIIPKIRKLTEKYLFERSITIRNSTLEVLNTDEINQEWVIEQCLCILEFIEKLDLKLLEKINSADSVSFTQNFIYGFQAFNKYLTEISEHPLLPNKVEPIYNPFEADTLPNTTKENYITAMQAFTTAKMNSFYAGIDSYRTPEYKREITPFMIRQAIEVKVIAEMLGIHDAYDTKCLESYKRKIISITKYIEFIRDTASDLFDLPDAVTMDNILAVNKWTNQFIHSGINAFSWQVAKAISIIEPLFSINNDDKINTSGFDYRSRSFSFDELEIRLSAIHKNTKFIFIK